MTPEPKRFIIVGGGLAGSLLACMLGKAGHTVAVYERRPDPRAQGFAGGRSINLAISARGIRALRSVGLDEQVLADAIPMHGRMMHARDGELTFQYYSAHHEDAINSVSRGGLNITLLDAADEYENVTLHFSSRFIDMDTRGEEPTATFADENTGIEEQATGDFIIGADGAYSAVRLVMQKREGFNYSQEYLSHGYKELSIPPTDRGEFALERHALHIWPRGGYMMIALPNTDRSFTCTLFHPLKGRNSFEALKTRADVMTFFEKSFPDAVPMMPTLAEDFFTNPTGTLVTIRSRPWHMEGRVLLIGDAAHAIVPFYGQGMNAAFEDCVELMRSFRRVGSVSPEAMGDFARRRKPHADAIADLAIDNFLEMRDKVTSRAFLLRKKLEHAMHRVMPGVFQPLYNMISFTSIPYAKARRRARQQWRIVRLVAALIVTAVLGAIVWLVAALV